MGENLDAADRKIGMQFPLNPMPDGWGPVIDADRPHDVRSFEMPQGSSDDSTATEGISPPGRCVCCRLSLHHKPRATPAGDRADDRSDSDIDLLGLTSRPLNVAEGFHVTDLLQPVQHRHDCIISLLRLTTDEWYHGVYQVLGIRHEIDREGIDVPLASGAHKTWQPESASR